eukprot:3948671-Prymnesium_polylepis.1
MDAVIEEILIRKPKKRSTRSSIGSPTTRFDSTALNVEWVSDCTAHLSPRLPLSTYSPRPAGRTLAPRTPAYLLSLGVANFVTCAPHVRLRTVCRVFTHKYNKYEVKCRNSVHLALALGASWPPLSANTPRSGTDRRTTVVLRT